MDGKQAIAVISIIKRVAFNYVETAIYRLSPDPKDNYLFDLAIQNNCVFIITDDTELLHLRLKPIPIHSSNWFLKTFPCKQRKMRDYRS